MYTSRRLRHWSPDPGRTGTPEVEALWESIMYIRLSAPSDGVRHS